MGDGPKKFVIVGGGTSGWMAASCLARLFAANPNSGHSVTLVESEVIGTVGVGEATIPTILDFISFLKVDQADFIRKTNSTMKLAIKFRDWRVQGEDYWHPFGTLGPSIENRPLFNYWFARNGQGATTGDLMDLSIAIQLAEQDKFALPDNDPRSPLGGLKFALHFDAGLVAKYLHDYAVGKGCKRIEGKVIDVAKSADDAISSITLESGETVEGDFFIDCSGFRGLLIEKEMGSPYEDWSEWLPCNSAIAAPTQLDGATHPYTVSTARSAGWTWRIPLQSRTGNGYVYSNRFISDEDAKTEFLAAIGSESLAEPRVLRFTGGMRREIWRGNCLSLGLASGFLEPLESTSIHLVFINLFRFLDHFPASKPDPKLIDRFNRLAADEMEEIRDFLVLHYCLSERRDSEFWRHVTSMELPSSLQQKIDLFEENGRILSHHDDLFTNISWAAVLNGMGSKPSANDPLTGLIPDDFKDNVMRDMQAQIRSTAAAAPSHDEFLAGAQLLAKAG
ncbi:MAG: tryptophan halogenase family protein [Roseobacter sp.]